MPLVNIYQNTPEWEEYRKDKIGASDVPYILGLSPYGTAFEWWQKKCGFVKQLYTSAMKAGHDIENTLRIDASLKYETIFTNPVFQHPEYSWACASLDGFCPKKNLLLEIKLTNRARYEEVSFGVCPDDWYAQIQWQLWVTSFPSCILVVHNAGRTSFLKVHADSRYIEELLTQIMDMHHCVITMTPPEKSEKDYRYIEDDRFSDLSANRKVIKERMDKDAAILKMIEDEMKEIAGGSNCMGDIYRMTWTERKGAIDWNRFAKEKGFSAQEIESYRKEPSSYYLMKEIEK